MVLMAMAARCELSSRRCAVTTISAKPMSAPVSAPVAVEGAPPAGVAVAAGSAPAAPARIKEIAVARTCRLNMNCPVLAEFVYFVTIGGAGLERGFRAQKHGH